MAYALSSNHDEEPATKDGCKHWQTGCDRPTHDTHNSESAGKIQRMVSEPTAAEAEQ